MERRGIACAGNFIIDNAKVVDLWPEQGMLANILEEQKSNGGCAYNVLKDLARLGMDIPLYGIGLVSDDEDGFYIIEDLKRHKIDTSMMQFIDNASTSYTDVITVKGTGNRTFFYNKGTNRYLDINHFDFTKVRTKIFHIGYILLLDSLDAHDNEYGTRMAKLLSMAKQHGLKTSVDVVSESSYRFKEIVTPSLKYSDYLIVNEIEAGRTAGYEIREQEGKLNKENLIKVMNALIENGNSELVCIHFPEGAYACERGGTPHFVPSHDPPEGFIKGTVGAGDAFCAGMLYGLHEGWNLDRNMRFANAMACMCLTDTNTSGGMKSMEETLRLMEEMPLRANLFL
jgi:sugar/nucleoside kinase (ribokinase family)